VIRPLVEQARDLNRRIYASFPWGYRVAGLLIKLSYGITETLGNSLYGVFIEQGVEGMPAIDGEPAELKLPKIKGHPERLPKNYGRPFGERLYAFLLSKIRNPDSVEEIISRFLVKLSAGKIKIRPGTDLRGAETYVTQILRNEVIDFVREGGGGRADRGIERRQMVDIDEAVDLSDPNSFRHLDNLLPKGDLTKLLRELEGIDHRAPSWLEAQLEGISSKDLAADWGVSEPRIVQWKQLYLPRIKQMVLKYLQEAA
jgi:DNA-directed RNA polymerase specialized sigma24 family protein